MTNILAFDTALDKTYIALSLGGEDFFEEIKSDENNYHSAYLIPKIKQMLDEKNILPAQLDVLATNAGPGSFTGIRAALSVAKVMALELDLPVISLNSAEILKCAYPDKQAVILLDARRGMYYFYESGEIELILKDSVAQKISNRTIVCDTNVFKDFSDFKNKFVNYEEENFELSKALLKLAKDKLNASSDIRHDFNANKLKANYIQTPPVFSK